MGIHNRKLGLQKNKVIKRKFYLHKYIIFFLWPFLTLLIAIRKFRTQWAMNIFWLYSIFFGFTFVIVGTEVDAFRYADQLVYYANHSEYNFSLLFSSYLSEGGNLDIAQILLTYIVSFFTNDYRYLFAIFGFFMGYFISRYIWLLVKKINIKLSYFTGLLFISYALVIGIWDIGGIRWNLAGAIFFFSVLNYFENKNKKYLWLALTIIFVHWSFSLALLVLLVYLILGNRTSLYFVIFILSFLISEINMDVVRNYFADYAPIIVQESRGSYLNQGYVDIVSDSKQMVAWYLTYHLLLLKWFIMASAIYIYIKVQRRERENQVLFDRLFNFALFFYGVFNLLSTIPSVERFLYLGSLMFLYIIIIHITFMKNEFPFWLKLIGMPILLLFIIVRIRIGFDYIGVWSVIANPLMAIFVENEVPLIDIVKGLF